uniref:Uncharacterized protein n=1 Tax=Corethron hystrix TaxID=216773 RepID=A0A7S1BLZ3_9STRA|mmetsp:Transcript_33444/g.77123  ORF Transcript_33444/g.77123 Transcript_33444/m.77123 type:complete len:213 (+) Transcript_33444:324-962(+)|eukprot:CAMPEP_0113305042 /NCGR_PEP_ID=MMETSP0010_2-20120614/4813_1 /TAXON_ID=216773 ORGANISM="Corethron hystrix, Strain 308" /NCGR_SAMPLE_ID=MMETSP0010_2 /ASSEMBLY_ACC=CAM_ASM_000155 /LENGTH=212 /DNA_ID=CAMNT_0000159353 /DNA_START=228 /DNA_END=866 /DNA_ORIENTATION=+ /assembly_acc=CAM_ASM_000155
MSLTYFFSTFCANASFDFECHDDNGSTFCGSEIEQEQKISTPIKNEKSASEIENRKRRSIESIKKIFRTRKHNQIVGGDVLCLCLLGNKRFTEGMVKKKIGICPKRNNMQLSPSSVLHDLTNIGTPYDDGSMNMCVKKPFPKENPFRVKKVVLHEDARVDLESDDGINMVLKKRCRVESLFDSSNYCDNMLHQDAIVLAMPKDVFPSSMAIG